MQQAESYTHHQDCKEWVDCEEKHGRDHIGMATKKGKLDGANGGYTAHNARVYIMNWYLLNDEEVLIGEFLFCFK